MITDTSTGVYDVEIVVTEGAGDNSDVICVMPFEFDSSMGAGDYEKIIAVFNMVSQLYENWPHGYINVQLRFNRNFVNA